MTDDDDLIFIKLYNSMSRQKELFKPIDPSRVTMYVCGPTIYDAPHIGNARSAIVFDQLYRILLFKYGPKQVVYARNFTDVDDKIIAAANKKNTSIKEITDWAEKIYLDNMDQLNVLRPTIMPKATDYINQMDDMINQMVNSGHAYITADNEVLFHVPASNHQSLVKHEDDQLIVGYRVDVNPNKLDQRDFILWKPNKKDEPFWEGTYGPGRPGWHIECSTMINELFGPTVDIHGGGQDLRFPHHESEIAQSHACHNAPLANYWLHNGMVTVDDGSTKMAKRNNNFVTVDDALKKYPGETIRFFLLKTHYSKPLTWTWDGLEEAHQELSSLYRKLRDNPENQIGTGMSVHVLYPLLDDLNTPNAIAGLHFEADAEISGLKVSGRLMGLLQQNPHDWFKLGTDFDNEYVQSLIDKRNEARKNKDWETADFIRKALDKLDIVLEDTPNGTDWRVK